jgi:DNA gyrase subunit B
MSNKLYTDKSIESLSPLEFTRLRPGVYAGDTTYSTQLLVEIVSNAIDEYRLGHGNQIDVVIDGSKVSVQDRGQGFIPNSVREDGKTILEAAFSVLNTSGKYREDGTYEGTSLGSFGIGSKITTFLSHWLKVTTYRDGMYEEITFKEGEFEKRHTGTTKSPSGTEVIWLPSEEFFKHTEVDIKAIKSLFKTIVCLCPGLLINLNNNGELTAYQSKYGLHDLVDETVGDKELIKNRLAINFEEGKHKLDLVMTYTSNYSSTIVPYVNTGLTETGPHITQIKTALTREMNKFFREKGWIKEKEENLTGEDIQEGMYMVFNATAPGVSYDAQVKSRITAIETKPFVSAFVEALNAWLITNEKEVKGIADKALNARKAREAAKKAREAIRTGPKEKKTVLKLPSKLTDCWSKDRAKCEIFIVEGDSAGGNMKVARDNEFQAILPIRGKVLNCEKASLDKMMANAEIRDMIKAFGLDLNPKTGKVVFDKTKLRYGKIFISADADVDGSHIQSLFYTFIWNFCPELIIEGYVYATIPPLYKLTLSNGYKYIQDDAALERFKAENPGKKYSVNRLKGLGEMDADELEETLLNIDGRHYKQITVEDVAQANVLFDQLMGTSAVPRKKFIEEHSNEAEVEV